MNLAAHVQAGRFNWEQFGRSVALSVPLADAAVELPRSARLLWSPPVVASAWRLRAAQR